jgi:hypothetical protein
VITKKTPKKSSRLSSRDRVSQTLAELSAEKPTPMPQAAITVPITLTPEQQALVHDIALRSNMDSTQKVIDHVLEWHGIFMDGLRPGDLAKAHIAVKSAKAK